MARHITRREAIGMGLGLVGGALGCRFKAPTIPDPVLELRLAARPGTPTGSVTPGLKTLDVAPREALLYVPPGYDPANPAPIVLMLHGAAGNAQQPIDLYKSLADTAGLLLTSCKSRDTTWSGIFGEHDADIPLFDQVLQLAFDMCAVDPTRVGIEGFSDGASYALQVGRANGDLFTRVVSHSAGLLLFTTGVQQPRFFISHGAQDDVVSVQTGRFIANQLAKVYDVRYNEFTGGHSVPTEIASGAVTFLTEVDLASRSREPSQATLL